MNELTPAETAFLDGFERVLSDGLVKICDNFGYTSGCLLDCPDAQEKWDNSYLQDYVADAVQNFNTYPNAAIAWSAFLGMGVATMWDRDWTTGSQMSYKDYYGSRGWDDMDEHILHDLMYLNLEKDEAKRITSALLSCAQATQELIVREGIEAQSSRGFFVLVRCYCVFYKLGLTIALRRLGYKKVKIH